jgi:broad specificity phosphatase PhoE
MSGIWLVRHGVTVTPTGIAVGAGDPPLSPTGHAQAVALADRLAARPLTRVYSSDLSRALETARPVAARHGIAVELVAALREIDFGDWEGRSLAGLWQEEGAAAGAWEADIRSTPPSFGESFDELERRVTSWWGSIRATVSEEIAIVGHRGSLTVLWSLLTGRSTEESFRTKLEPGDAILI